MQFGRSGDYPQTWLHASLLSPRDSDRGSYSWTIYFPSCAVFFGIHGRAEVHDSLEVDSTQALVSLSSTVTGRSPVLEAR